MKCLLFNIGLFLEDRIVLVRIPLILLGDPRQRVTSDNGVVLHLGFALAHNHLIVHRRHVDYIATTKSDFFLALLIGRDAVHGDRGSHAVAGHRADGTATKTRIRAPAASFALLASTPSARSPSACAWRSSCNRWPSRISSRRRMICSACWSFNAMPSGE